VEVEQVFKLPASIQEINGFFFKALTGDPRLVIDFDERMVGREPIQFRSGQLEMELLSGQDIGSPQQQHNLAIRWVVGSNRILLWTMRCVGWCSRDATQFLRRALKETFEIGVFIGGRGPKRFGNSVDCITYFNSVYRIAGKKHEKSDGFVSFSGHEGIYHEGAQDTSLGNCRYMGGFLQSVYSNR
jgi:hypothetical protein